MGCSNSNDVQKNQKIDGQQIPEQEKQRLENIASTTPIRKLYKFEKILGTGGFGIVKLARIRSNPNKKVAIKILEKSKLKDKQYILLRELEVLIQLDHPNIIKFYEVYQDQMWFYIVMEYCAGGELLASITQKNYFKEKEAAKIMYKLISAVNHMHAMGIIHRDLKPENIMLTSRDPDAEIKIIDFGLSIKYDKQNIQQMVGTPLYIAPEVLEGISYGEQCDMWSIGVIMYILLSGSPPFFGTQNEIFYKITNAIYSLQTADWQRVSDSAKDLISKLIQKDVDSRLKSQEAFRHPWFQQADRRISKIENTDSIDPRIINLLKTYRTTSKFKTEVMKVFVNQLNEKDIIELKNAFLVIDKDKTGLIKRDQLLNVIINSGVNIDSEELEQIVKKISPQNNMQFEDESYNDMTIKYSDFIAATLDQQMYLSREKLWGLFNYFDSSKMNFITLHDLKDIFARNGQHKTDNEIKLMIKEVDPNSDGKISFEEFEILMKGENIPLEEIENMNESQQ